MKSGPHPVASATRREASDTHLENSLESRRTTAQNTNGDRGGLIDQNPLGPPTVPLVCSSQGPGFPLLWFKRVGVLRETHNTEQRLDQCGHLVATGNRKGREQRPA